MTDGLVSVIIPVYKAERSLGDCLQSIINQTYSRLEIILIDDGSPDESLRICKKWEQEDERICVIHQMNAGASAARNTGLGIATGKWIVFLDADDIMAPEAIEEAMMLAENNHCDTVCWNCFRECRGVIQESPGIKPDNSIYEGKQINEVLIEALYYTRVQTFYPGQMFRAAWGKLLSAQIIRDHEIYFPVGLPLGEDAAFLMEYFQSCNKVLMVNRYWNYYRVSPFSAVGRYKRNLRDIQAMEMEVFLEKVHAEGVDLNTILLNQYLQYDYQYVHNLCKAEKNVFAVYREMVAYIKQRMYRFNGLYDYDLKKIPPKSIWMARAMVYRLTHIEAAVCVIREWKHRRKI